MKILIGVPTYGNWRYTYWTLFGIRRAIKHANEYYKGKHDFLVKVIVGKPEGSEEFVNNLVSNFKDLIGDGLDGRHLSIHSDNEGLPFSINEVFYDLLSDDYDYALIVGNDVILARWFLVWGITVLEDYEKLGRPIDWLSGIERRLAPVNAYDYVDDRHIRGAIPHIDRPYETPGIRNDLNKFAVIGDSFNATFFSRRLVETIGYVDCNFWPAYFSDNDYARRAQLAEMNLKQFNGLYLHLWSRTIYNETYKGRSLKEINDFIFPRNKIYYERKWGGEPGKEKFTMPFNGDRSIPKFYSTGIMEVEPFNKEAISFWRSLVITHFNL